MLYPYLNYSQAVYTELFLHQMGSLLGYHVDVKHKRHVNKTIGTQDRSVKKMCALSVLHGKKKTLQSVLLIKRRVSKLFRSSRVYIAQPHNCTHPVIKVYHLVFYHLSITCLIGMQQSTNGIKYNFPVSLFYIFPN